MNLSHKTISVCCGAAAIAIPFVFDAYGRTAYSYHIDICAAAVFIFFNISMIAFGRRGIVRIGLSPTDIAAAAMASYLLAGALVRSDDVMAVEVALCTGAYLAGRLADKRIIFIALAASGTAEAIISAAQLLHLHASNNPLFAMTGSFGNPAQVAGYLLITLAATLQLLRRGTAVIALPAAALQLAAIALSDSRAAMLAVAIAAVWYFSAAMRPPVRIIVISAVAAATLAGLTSYKQESAAGRLLIWRTAVPMIAESPVTGLGHNAFEKQYMHAQAEYFRTHAAEQSASNVAYPYNETLRMAIEHGAVGLLLCIGFAATLLLSRKCDDRRIVRAGAVAVIVYAQFSYPTYVTPTLFAAALSAGAIGDGGRTVSLPAKWPRRAAIASGAAAAAAILSTLPFWNSAAELRGDRARISCNRNLFAMLSAAIADDPATREDEILPTCENCCRLAEAYARDGQTDRAEKLLIEASLMIPSRMEPLYRLFRLYADNGLDAKAARQAAVVANHRPKIENTLTIKMRDEAERYLKCRTANE